jgi:hypothetical protein
MREFFEPGAFAAFCEEFTAEMTRPDIRTMTARTFSGAEEDPLSVKWTERAPERLGLSNRRTVNGRLPVSSNSHDRKRIAKKLLARARACR